MSAPDKDTTGRGRELEQILRQGARRSRFGRLLGGVGLAILVVVALLLYRAFVTEREAPAIGYRTEPVSVGPLVVRVSATGNLQPTNQVDVGSELSGIVEQVFVDDNDLVKQGQILARLDLAKLQDAVAESRANLAVAKAQVQQADATVAEARLSLNRLRQVSELSGGRVPSKLELDTADANLKRALAGAASARAGVDQAGARLQSDETNLGKAAIRSPINGVVLSRHVEPGQTVAASFQAPVLFTLAEDLTKMQLQVNVDEADVGQVRNGQPATFSVDAWPGREYRAVISRVSYGSQITDGVVSYRTILDVNNDDLSLRPGMTGTAEITTLTRDKALLVPNAALRYSPTPVTSTPQTQRSVLRMLFPRPPRPSRQQATPTNGAKPQVWVLRNGKPAPVAVNIGASDGRVTEITGGDLKAGMAVIVEETGSAP